ncbi:MAG: metal ABC transporter ATP-binding protein [Marmoricola sp.]
MSEPDHVIDVRGAAVTIGGRPILRDLDLTVRRGEVVALMGANGSGKSTLVKTVLGLNPLAAGEIRLFGSPLRDFRAWHRLGYVPQRSTITQGVPATVTEVVASGRMARRRPFVPAGRADRAAVRDAIATVGLTDRSRHAVGTLSGGQQQRVLMARTLAGDPELLVLDEPNAGVDRLSQEAIARTLAERAARGATILVVLHEPGPFAPLIRRTLVMQEGRLVHDGPAGPEPFHDEGHHHREATPTVRPEVSAPLERDG